MGGAEPVRRLKGKRPWKVQADFLKRGDIPCQLNQGCKSSRKRLKQMGFRIFRDAQGPACFINQLSHVSSDGPKTALGEPPPSQRDQHATVLWPNPACCQLLYILELRMVFIARPCNSCSARKC